MIELQKTSYLDHTIRTEPLQGDVFTDEQGGHKLIITCYQHGERVNLTGTISGRFMRPGGTVALTGSVSDGQAIITLSSECYERNGGFLLTVFNTVGNDKFVIYACTGNVRRSKSDPLIDGGEIIDSVENLISDIQTAVAQIPVNYNASFAPAYSTTSSYAVGDYVTNSGNLYRCTTAITSGETFDPTHWVQVTLGNEVSDLKGIAADERIMNGRIYKTLIWKSGTVQDNTDIYKANSKRIITQHILMHTKHIFIATDPESTVSLYLYEYDKGYNFLRARSWFSGYQYYVLNDNTQYIRLILRDGNGQSEIDTSYGQYVISVYEPDPSASNLYTIYGDDYGTTWGKLNNDGTVTPATESSTDTFYYTDLIQIPDDIITTYAYLKARGTSSVPSVAFYDENQDFISKIYYGNVDEHVIKLPDNAVYYRLCSMTSALPMADAYLAFYISIVDIAVVTKKALAEIMIGEGEEWR